MSAVLNVALLLLMTYCILLGNVIILLCVAVVMPFSRRAFVHVGSFLQDSFLQLIVLVMEVFVQIRVEVSGDYLPPHESALVLPNHLTHDWAPLYCVAFRQQMLGYVKTVIKKSIRNIPGFGWGMWLLYWPFITRDSQRDVKYLTALFGQYRDLEMPVQLWLFCEGTRQTQAKLKESQTYARDKGYDHWDHVLLPRPKGFSVAVNSLRATVPYVYDVTLAYEGWKSKTPGLFAIFTPSKHPLVFHVHVRRLPMSDIPTSEEGQRDWLMKCFAAKDKVLAHYFANKRMPGTPHPVVRCSLNTFLVPLLFWAAVFVAGTYALYCWI